MIHENLTRILRELAGTPSAQAAFSEKPPLDFSRVDLLAELEQIRVALPPSPLRDRIFGVPEFLTKTPHESRVREWELSRSVLLAAFRGMNPAQCRYSFSHTGGAALAIVVGGGAKMGFGVDLEREGRAVSDAAFARFSTPEEAAILPAPLDQWILKEACYKAHPRSTETIVADYVVTGAAPGGACLVECAKGERVRFRGVLNSIDGFRYAFATETGP